MRSFALTTLTAALLAAIVLAAPAMAFTPTQDVLAGIEYDKLQGPRALALADNGRAAYGQGTDDTAAKQAALDKCSVENKGLKCRVVNVGTTEINENLNPQQQEMLRLIRSFPEICGSIPMYRFVETNDRVCVQAVSEKTFPADPWRRAMLATANHTPESFQILRKSLLDRCGDITGNKPAICTELAAKKE